MDLTTLTDDELDQQRIDVATEQERRQSVLTLSGQIEELTKRYKKASGKGEPAVEASARGAGVAQEKIKALFPGD